MHVFYLMQHPRLLKLSMGPKLAISALCEPH